MDPRHIEPGQSIEQLDQFAVERQPVRRCQVERPADAAFGQASKGRGTDGAAFRLGTELLSWWLARMIRGAALGVSPDEVVAGEAAVMARLLERRSLAQWLGLWEEWGRLFAGAEGANLDRKQVVVTAFLELEALAA